MKQKSFFKNVIYNFIYTGLNLLFPIITAPYVSRILGASNLGEVNFATTIVNWFILFAVFGTSTYGVREVAKIKNDREELNRVFSEIVLINAVLSIVVTLIYYVVVLNVEKFYSELPLFLIMSLSIILNMFAIDWFFQGVEEYRYITIRSAIFKMISLACIFIFINKAEHYVIYGLISVLASSLSGVLNYIYSRKYVKLQFKDIKPLRHIKSLIVFFMHTFIVSVYTNLDQTLLGIFNDTKAVAFMNRSKTVVNMGITLSTSISNVMLPRASFYMKNDEKKFKMLLGEVPNLILGVTIPITIGIICFSSNIMYILGGEEFLKASILLQIVALTIIFSPLSTYLQYQVLVASGNEKLGLYCAIITSCLSLILNFLLIPSIGIIGAGIVQIISEVFSLSLRYYISKKKLGYKEISFINKSSILYLVSGLLMSGVIILIRNMINDMFLSFLLGTISGIITYGLILLLMKERNIMIVIRKIKKNQLDKVYS